MSKKLFVSSIIVAMFSASMYAGVDLANNKSNVVTREIKNGKPVDTVYSEAKVEYADVKTIERLKRAVVILIDKVENFEKKLNAREVSRKDLNILKKDLKNNLTYKFEKKLNNLSIEIKHNTQSIKLLKEKNRQIQNKTVHKISKYDRKIKDFLKKQNSLKSE